MRVKTDINNALAGALRRKFALGFGNGFVEKLDIHIVADSFHVTMLLSAEDRACTSDLKVAHCDAEAAAELREFTDSVKTLCGYLGENFSLAESEICESASARTSYTSAELIKL